MTCATSRMLSHFLGLIILIKEQIVAQIQIGTNVYIEGCLTLSLTPGLKSIFSFFFCAGIKNPISIDSN